MYEHLDGSLVYQWARRATIGLKNHQAEINGLNVFPIPDSDTGTNMALTMDSAVVAADEVMSKHEGADVSVVEVSTALAQGAVRGARGNSGLVLSQVFRALADAAGKGPIDGQSVGQMLYQASGFARTAISTPVEGTVISVLSAAAAGAQQATEHSHDLAVVVCEAVKSAEKALAETPRQLSVLAESGVVDAGGKGFVIMLAALQQLLEGAAEEAEQPQAEMVVTQEVEVMFTFTVEQPKTIDQLRAVMEELGNSVVVGPISDVEATMHVHSNQAGPIIEKAFAMGSVTNLRIEVLPEVEKLDDAERAMLPVIAVCPADQDHRGVRDLFEKLGARTVISGLKGSQALAKTEGPTLVLTNGQDVSALREAASEQPLEFIDTNSVVGGLAAMAVFDTEADWEDTVDDILSAVSTQRTAHPAQDEISGKLFEYIDELLIEGGELLTILWDGDSQLEESVASAVAAVEQEHPELEVQVIHTSGLGVPIEIGVE